MTLPPKVRAMIVGSAITGAATLGVAALLARTSGVGPVDVLVPLTLLLALSWAYPVLVVRTEETEAFQLDEPFFAASALLLPAAGAIFVFAAATILGNVVRRRPLVRATFNIGQTVTATGLGVAVMHLFVSSGASAGGGVVRWQTLAATVVGAAVFLFVNSAAVSAVISLNEGKRAFQVFVEGLDLRVLVWAGGTSLGLLAGIGGSVRAWALALGAIPMAALNLVLHEHARARRQIERSRGLLVAANQIHAAVAGSDVDEAVTAAARSLLGCRRAWLGGEDPGPPVFSVPLPEPAAGRWLAVADPVGFERLGKGERELLAVLAGIAAGALHNAALMVQIRHRAIHDPLTELPNKVLFMDRLQHALDAAPRLNKRLAVMFLDLDQFKVINDSLGHETGDQVLLGVAARLRAGLRQGDTAARLGGDEFAVLCEQVASPEDGVLLAERVQAAASGFTVINGVELGVTASLGVVIVEPDAGVSAETLLAAADTAMYRAKDRGRDRVEVFDDQLRDRAFARLEIETTLRRALDEGRLRVYYQPILNTATGRVVEMEALLRIETVNGTVLGPADFIEVAEQSGLIATIGVQVLGEACRQAAAWRSRGPDQAPIRVAVNLSARQLSRIPLAATVKDALSAAGCTPDMLALELTETVLMETGEQVRDELEELRKIGVTVGLDDFGTGYSSLSYLKRFPVDFLKVDRCFVAGLGQDPGDEAIVNAVVSLGRSLGLSTVAEGVETVEQMDKLRALGCDRLQGYLFARPQPAKDLDKLLDGPWQAPPEMALAR